MMSKTGKFLHPATFFFILYILVVLISWVGSVYDVSGIQNLLSTEALRWTLRYSEENFGSCPALVAVCILFMGTGLFVHSGLSNVVWKVFSRDRCLSSKERNSLIFAACMAFFYIALFVVLACGPWNFVRSVIGTFKGSPLHDGLLIVISMGVGLTSVVYGFSADLYRRDTDVVNGMSFLFSRFSSYFVSLFFVVQFLSAFQYSGLVSALDISDNVFYGIQLVCYLIPFRGN